jgi:hypothetical protein
VGAIEVEVVEVLVKVALESGALGRQGASEGGPPALLEHSQLGAFDAAVGVGATGLDAPLAGAEALDRGSELPGAELRAVVGCDFAQAPAGGLQLTRYAVDELRGPAGPGVAL